MKCYSNPPDELAVVLLAEDNPADQCLARRLLSDGNIRCDLRIVSDGEQAMSYLLRQGEFEDPAASPTPGLILLDINMPKVNGITVLKALRTMDRFKDSAVAMLTTSDDFRRIVDCVQDGCSAYLSKPLTADKLLAAIAEPGDRLELRLVRPAAPTSTAP